MLSLLTPWLLLSLSTTMWYWSLQKSGIFYCNWVTLSPIPSPGLSSGTLQCAKPPTDPKASTSSTALHSPIASYGFSWFETSAALQDLFKTYIQYPYQVELLSWDMEMAASESQLQCICVLTPRKHFAEVSSSVMLVSSWSHWFCSPGGQNSRSQKKKKVLFQWCWTLVNHSRLFSFC